MALTADIDDMVTSVRSRTDQEITDHITDVEIREWLNTGIAKIYRKLFMRDPTWHIVAGSVATTDGTQEYILPENFLAMNGVHYLSGGITIEVFEVPFRERHQRQLSPFGVRYRIQRSGTDGSGVRIRFEPQPGARTYQYEYTPAPPVLAAGESWDGIAGFEEYPIEFACAKVRVKVEEDSTPHILAMREELEEVKKMAHRRNVGGGGPRIARTRRRRTHYGSRRGLGVP